MISTQAKKEMSKAFQHLVEIKKQNVETVKENGNCFSYVTKKGLTKKFVGFLTFGEYKNSNMQEKLERVNGFYFVEVPIDKHEIVKEICCSFGYNYTIFDDGRVVLDDGIGVDHEATTHWLGADYCGHIEYISVDDMLMDWLPDLKNAGMITVALADEIKFIESCICKRK